ncbi:hypothetical protein B4U79_17335 [Dinothrombium tinctorium]|uniref:EF-hand domain-containing protein n=1 Tax=Dinothrombium tinctorium TaxID=1965070 RepID=A0A443REU6_9ACAR|nr:hypothetical protein B4U79_17335 [Dinothrombium tinctorium]
MSAEGAEEHDDLETFVEETHLDLVTRMMHFYDVFRIDGKSRGASKDIGDVLRFIGWHHLDDIRINEFLQSIDVNPSSTNLQKQQVRAVFKQWIEKVASDANLLCECFQYFDIDDDGYISRDEIIKILYRTTEEERIKLIDDIISKLEEGVYYYEELGFRPKTKRTRRSEITESQTLKVAQEKVVSKTLWSRFIDALYNFSTDLTYAIFLECLFAWSIFLFLVIPFVDIST